MISNTLPSLSLPPVLFLSLNQPWLAFFFSIPNSIPQEGVSNAVLYTAFAKSSQIPLSFPFLFVLSFTVVGVPKFIACSKGLLREW
ncbi:unknown [Prevotella sp. CAG:1092]|nr:unknown [Prevotella sp. CAG:1092]